MTPGAQLRSAIICFMAAGVCGYGAWRLVGEGEPWTVLGVLAAVWAAVAAILGACYLSAWDLDRQQRHLQAELDAIRNRRRTIR